MYEIVPNLFLSSFRELDVDSSWLVVNCTKDLPMRSMGTRIPLDDSPDENENMYKAFSEIIPWLKSHRHQKVVVHCFAGQQRSAAVIAAFLMSKNHGLTLDQVMEYIKSKKSDAFAGHVTFRDALDRWIMSRTLLGIPIETPR